MPVYKHVVFFEVSCRGFSEVWYRSRGAAAPLNIVFEEATNFLVKRSLLLGAQGSIIAVRIGDADDELGVGSSAKGDARLFRQLFPGSPDYQCASPDLAAVTTWYDATGIRKRNQFLRGFDDNVEINGGQATLVGSAAVWSQRFNTFVDEVRGNGWGWLTRSVKATGGGVFGSSPLVTYNPLPADPRKVGVQFARAIFSVAEIEAGRPVEVVFSGVGGRGGSRLNGPQLIVPTSPENGYTYDPTALLPFTPGGVATRYTYTFADIADGRLAKIGKRAAGNVSGLSPGRVKAIPRG